MEIDVAALGGFVEHKNRFARSDVSPFPKRDSPSSAYGIPEEWLLTPYYIEFTGVNIHDRDLDFLVGAAEIGLLSLGFTDITDSGLEVVGQLGNLVSLGLEKTRITDEGLRRLSRLHQLVELDLSLTQISDIGLRHLQVLTSLKRLYLADTRVTPDGVRDFKIAVPGCEVELLK